MTHSKLPWAACGSAILSAGDAIQQKVVAVVHYSEMITPVSMVEREENKRLIVKCVNSHEALVAALDRLVAANNAHSTLRAEDGDDWARMIEYGQAYDDARVLLAIVKAQP